jgi:hypothetical protein
MANTRLSVVLIVVTITGVAVTLLLQHQAQTKLAEENAALRQQLAQAQADNESLSNTTVEAKSAEPPTTAPSDELLRLRGEIGMLRQQTNELAQLQQQNQRLLRQVAELSQSTNRISAEDNYALQQKHVVDAMTTVLGAIKNYTANHNGQYPENLQELVASGVLSGANFAGNLKLEDFDFYKPDSKEQLGNNNILRARTMIQHPGGVFMTVSGGIDESGTVHTEIRNWTPK